MYFLVMFYQNFKHELAPMHPLGKFLSIKAVIFFSFLYVFNFFRILLVYPIFDPNSQGVILTLLIHLGVITRAFIPISPDISTNEMSRNLQDFLICFEMLLAAIAHIYVFSHRPYIDAARGTNPLFLSFTRIVDFTDERSDVADHFRHIGNRVKNIWAQNPNYPSSYDDPSSRRPLIPMSVRKTYGSSSNQTIKGFQKI